MRSVYYYYYYETHLRQFVLSGRVATRRIVDSRLCSSVVGQLAGAAARGRRGRREADDGTGGQEPGAGRREPVPDVLDRQQVGRLKLYVPPDRSDCETVGIRPLMSRKTLGILDDGRCGGVDRSWRRRGI